MLMNNNPDAPESLTNMQVQIEAHPNVSQGNKVEQTMVIVQGNRPRDQPGKSQEGTVSNQAIVPFWSERWHFEK